MSVLAILLAAMSLQVTSIPRVSLVTPSSPAHVKIKATLVGEESEKYYCPEVVFIFGEGINKVESVHQEDCLPFEERNNPPPPDPECPSCEDRDPQGFPREWGKWFSFAYPGDYKVVIELRQHEEAERLTDHTKCKVIIRGHTTFQVR